MTKTANRLCIIGSAPSKKLAPYDDKGFDIWAISGAVFSESLGWTPVADTEENGWNSVHRVDVFFEMHKRPVFSEKLDRLAKCGKPVIMQRRERDIPTSEAFPADEIADQLGEDYSSTIAYMMAYAIWLGYEEIRLYGVVLLHKDEYMRQRPGIKYYLGVAHARGIVVWAPDDTLLIRPSWRYGYDDHDALCLQIAEKKKTIDDDIVNQTKLIEAQKATLWQLKGASITCENLISEIKGGLA